MSTLNGGKEPVEKTASKEPLVGNYPRLRDWLRARNGSCVWRVESGRSTNVRRFALEGWLVGEAIVIVQLWTDGLGWDLFTPCADTSVDATLADADARCKNQ